MHITARNPPYCTPAPSVVSLRSGTRCGVQPVTRVSRVASLSPARFIRLQTEPARLKTQTTTFTVQYSLLYLHNSKQAAQAPKLPKRDVGQALCVPSACAPALGTIFLNCTHCLVISDSQHWPSCLYLKARWQSPHKCIHFSLL